MHEAGMQEADPVGLDRAEQLRAWCRIRWTRVVLVLPIAVALLLASCLICLGDLPLGGPARGARLAHGAAPWFMILMMWSSA